MLKVLAQKVSRSAVRFYAMLALGLVMLRATASKAAVEAGVQAIVDDADTLFTDVKAVVITIVAFGIIIWIAKKVRRA